MSFPRRAAVAVAIAGLAAAFIAPASATGCRVDVDVDVTTAVVGVHVSVWHDEGQEEPGVKGEKDVEITTPSGGTSVLHSSTNNPAGPGLVEQTTGVDVREIVCGALES